jgi:hypothetical protein
VKFREFEMKDRRLVGFIATGDTPILREGFGIPGKAPKTIIFISYAREVFGRTMASGKGGTEATESPLQSVVPHKVNFPFNCHAIDLL